MSRLFILSALVVSLASVSCQTEVPADLILAGGTVWTAGSPRDAAPTAIAVRDGKIVAVGSDAEIERLTGPSTERIALDGRMLVPGFIDNHTHFIAGGFDLSGVQLRDADSPEEFSRRIADFARVHREDWMTGGQWDHEAWGGELPHRDWIDAATPDTPVFVERLDGHMSLANSKTLELAGINTETPDPEGGTIVRDPDGRPTGVLKDEAQSLVYPVMPKKSEEELDRALGAAARHALENGVTFVTDMGSFESLETYRRVHARGELPLRLYSVVPIADHERLASYVAEKGRGDERLMWGGVKGFVDGSLGSTTAWFYRPYEDEPHTSGLRISDGDELSSSVSSSDAAGLHVMVHAIGDQANDWLLDAFAGAVEQNGPRDRRFRIEHAQHLSPEAVGRFGDQSVIASMQPYHAIDDGRWAEKRIGAERALTTYAFRSLLDAEATLTFGSDWRVAPLDPIAGVYAAVTRRTIDGANPEGWVPSQKISVEEALEAYTSANAFASYREHDLGAIELGYLADLVVLSENPFEVAPEEIENVRVDLTVVDGEIVYRR